MIFSVIVRKNAFIYHSLRCLQPTNLNCCRKFKTKLEVLGTTLYIYSGGSNRTIITKARCELKQKTFIQLSTIKTICSNRAIITKARCELKQKIIYTIKYKKNYLQNQNNNNESKIWAMAKNILTILTF